MTLTKQRDTLREFPVEISWTGEILCLKLAICQNIKRKASQKAFSSTF